MVHLPRALNTSSDVICFLPPYTQVLNVPAQKALNETFLYSDEMGLSDKQNLFTRQSHRCHHLLCPVGMDINKRRPQSGRILNKYLFPVNIHRMVKNERC